MISFHSNIVDVFANSLDFTANQLFEVIQIRCSVFDKMYRAAVRDHRTKPSHIFIPK